MDWKRNDNKHHSKFVVNAQVWYDPTFVQFSSTLLSNLRGEKTITLA